MVSACLRINKPRRKHLRGEREKIKLDPAMPEAHTYP